MRLSQYFAIALVVIAVVVAIYVCVHYHHIPSWSAALGALGMVIQGFCRSLSHDVLDRATAFARGIADFIDRAFRIPPAPPGATGPASDLDVSPTPASGAILTTKEPQTMFNFFSQLLGSKKGHAVNTAIDNAAPALIETAVPGSAAVINLLDPHPAGTTATVAVTTPQGNTLQTDIDIAGKVLLAVDPQFIGQVNEFIGSLLGRFGAIGAESAQFVEGWADAKLEAMGFTPPTEVTPPALVAANAVAPAPTPKLPDAE